MSRGGRRRPRFSLGISRLGSRGAAEPPGGPESAAGQDSAAGTPLSLPAPVSKKAIDIAKVALQVAAACLKAAPIPNLDQIPIILLMLIQTYEVSRTAVPLEWF